MSRLKLLGFVCEFGEEGDASLEKKGLRKGVLGDLFFFKI